MIGLLAAIGLIALIVLLIPLSIFINAFVLQKLWTWFLIPLGLPPIGLAHAWGLAILVGMFTYHTKLASKDKKEQAQQAAVMMIGPFMALLAGYITHQMMM